MNILVLTDHGTHGSSNSMYGIVRSLSQKSEVALIHVASRTDARNQAFFQGEFRPEIQVIKGDDDFCFPRDHAFKAESFSSKLAMYDVILLRLPRPIPDDFFSMLKKQFQGKKIVNSPEGIEITSSKAFLLNLDRFVVPMALITSLAELLAFKQQFPCVLKPLRDYGGRGLVKVEDDQVSLEGAQMDIGEFISEYQKNPQTYLGMKFLKNVDQGDKRIVVAGGEIVATSLRLPADGNWLCNVAQGGKSQHAEPDETEHEIVEYLDPILRKEGIFMYGLDTLVDDDGKRIISEVNTLSPGGVQAFSQQTDAGVFDRLTSSLLKYIKD